MKHINKGGSISERQHDLVIQNQEFKMSRVHKVPTLISKYWATQFKTNIKSFITLEAGPLFQSYIVEIIRN